jgi:BirA family biotin operon repressor/biotin-[acetyl-CoA-carboxylase] ligase
VADANRYEGHTPDEWRAVLGVPRVELLETVTSTLDVAHALGAAGAPSGTLVIAERQTAGRGRAGRTWTSEAGAGIWLTLVERPDDPAALEVLAIRLGLAAARALDPFAPEPVRLKWPNDLYVGKGKVAGVLVESRWRGERPDWTAVGIGVNVRAPTGVPGAGALAPSARRAEVLTALVPALRAQLAAVGPLGPQELAAYRARDFAAGRACRAPAHGLVAGITPHGAVVIRTEAGDVVARTGSLVLADGP